MARRLSIIAKGLSAFGFVVGDQFVVLAGSQSPKEPAPSIPRYTQRMRETLLSEGVFVEENGCYRMARDYTFPSPSSAAGALLARSANGRDEWTDDKGRTLNDIRRETS
jgi:hypothetical protein